MLGAGNEACSGVGNQLCTKFCASLFFSTCRNFFFHTVGLWVIDRPFCILTAMVYFHPNDCTKEMYCISLVCPNNVHHLKNKEVIIFHQFLPVIGSVCWIIVYCISLVSPNNVNHLENKEVSIFHQFLPVIGSVSAGLFIHHPQLFFTLSFCICHHCVNSSHHVNSYVYHSYKVDIQNVLSISSIYTDNNIHLHYIEIHTYIMLYHIHTLLFKHLHWNGE